MNTRTTTARGRAVAGESQSIDASQQRAIAARAAQPSKPRNALEAMSQSLDVSPSTLKNTLINTVFKGCRNEEEFVALVIVANTFGLNPLTKEIYAFPAKGGGVVPMVSVDGWIKLMHTHPKFDVIEFEDHLDDNGAVYAIEASITRTDKSKPFKVVEYLDECKRNTDPWNKSPSRMLRHRALIQCARIAFGFSGIAAPQDDSVEGIIIASDDTTPILPNQQNIGDQIDDEIPDFAGGGGQADPETGEIVDQQTAQDTRGMTEISEEEARALDNADDDQGDDQGPGEEADPDEPGYEEPMWIGQVAALRSTLAKAATIKAVTTLENQWINQIRNGIADEDVVRSVEQDIASKKRAIKAKGEQ